LYEGCYNRHNHGNYETGHFHQPSVTLNLNIVILANKHNGGKTKLWLVILAFAATIATALWYSKAENDKYMLSFLSLILWGTTIMVVVDHTLGFLMEGGEFLEITTEAMVLSGVMVLAALVVWEGALLLKDPRGVIYKRKST